MTGPVLHLPNQRPRLAEPLEQPGHDLTVGPLRTADDVVGLAGYPASQDEVDCGGVIRHVQPVATLETVAVERQREVVDGVGDEQGDQLLGVVIRAVRVRPAGDHGIDAVGDHVAPDQQFAGGLGCRVGRSGRERRVLPDVAFGHGAVDLVGGHLEEARMSGREPARLEQDVDADHAGGEERLGIQDRAIHVRLCGEVDDPVHAGDERSYQVRVGDVASNEREPVRHLRVGSDDREIGLVARIRQLVEDRDPRAVATAEDVSHVTGPDEARAAGDQQALEPPLARHVSPATGSRAAPAVPPHRPRPPGRPRAEATARCRRRSSARRRRG